ncbi:MAG: glycerol-3-phosphate 1-O-acyltransferase PlsY [Alphaproteobacteria bacterium]|nr:glycerol-3-phosphate 1-O-acyltransferase PlsY [Alphaproteobacteria bacterium]
MLYAFSIVLSYLLGSIPFGLIVSKLFNKIDIRKVGSGNIGATNVMRVGGLKLAGLVWVLDMLKAMIAVYFGRYVGGDVFAVICGLVAIIGHCFPVWLDFHGGKGVSCLFGVLLATNPILFIVCGLCWLIVALGTGFSSAGALVAFVLMPILGFCITISIGFVFLGIAILCVWRHQENIKRLYAGTESKIEWRWKK